jgi:ferritin-like metal-binding protein YciE
MGGRTSRASAVSAEEEEDMQQGGEMLDELFMNMLKDIYWAEKHLIKALAKMAKNATSEELQEAFQNHRAETEVQVQRLEQVFEILGEKAKGKKCEAMAGLTAEAEEVISDTEDDTFTRDVGLIVSAQKVEHYEIASYGSLAQVARTANKPQELIDLLEETLEEEKNTDELLTSIAEGFINERATQE